MYGTFIMIYDFTFYWSIDTYYDRTPRPTLKPESLVKINIFSEYLIERCKTASLVDLSNIISLHLSSITSLAKLIERETNIHPQSQRLWICQNQYVILYYISISISM
jgi:hypothetical protein